MELVVLKRYAGGYRGCVRRQNRYAWFQWSRRKGLQWLKTYEPGAFSDLQHFAAMMAKFVSTTAILVPPVPIDDLQPHHLEQAWRQVVQRRVRQPADRSR